MESGREGDREKEREGAREGDRIPCNWIRLLLSLGIAGWTKVPNLLSST